MDELKDHNIPRKTSCCVVRPQEKQYVVYNTRTDELYLLPPTAFYIYQLCNGTYTVENLEMLLKDSFDETEMLKIRLRDFLMRLIERGILEVEE